MASPTVQKKILAQYTNQELQCLQYDWKFWSRSKQRAPEWDWRTWLIHSGRGFGKTRTGIEWVRDNIERLGMKRGTIVAPTPADIRESIVEGESGFLECCPPWFYPEYKPALRRLIWPNGATVLLLSAETPRSLRNKQHQFLWMDEFAHFKDPVESWIQGKLGLRLGPDPRMLITTTPLPIEKLREIIKLKTTHTTGGSSYENLQNVAESYFDILVEFEGSRVGDQEIHGQILETVEGALWNIDMIAKHRVTRCPNNLDPIEIAVDPAVTATKTADETGIVVGGTRIENGVKHYYIMKDRSLVASPLKWAEVISSLYDYYGANRVVAETNNGGDLVKQNIHIVDKTIRFKKVWASKGKALRAEPVVTLYEQGVVHHVGHFPLLERELTTWVQGDKSPNRLDALVYLILGLKKQGAMAIA